MATPDWKVLLIGGGTGTAKSTLALELGRFYDVPVLDGDDLRWAIESAVPSGLDPELHIFQAPGFWDQPVAEDVERMLSWSKRLCEINETVIARRHFVERPVIIEAVWLLPEFVCQSKFNDVSMEGEVRSIFLVENDKELLRERLFDRDGEMGLPVDQPSRIDVFHQHGLLIAEKARLSGLSVLESRSLETLFHRAVEALAKD